MALGVAREREAPGTGGGDRSLILRSWEKPVMKKLSVISGVLCVALAAALPTAAFSRGGMGSHHSSTTGGAFGTSPTAPGTNSLGTALSSSGGSGAAEKGPALGTGNPAVDREDARVARMVESICRGC